MIECINLVLGALFTKRVGKHEDESNWVGLDCVLAVGTRVCLPAKKGNILELFSGFLPVRLPISRISSKFVLRLWPCVVQHVSLAMCGMPSGVCYVLRQLLLVDGRDAEHTDLFIT